jgi:hypothetical protein
MVAMAWTEFFEVQQVVRGNEGGVRHQSGEKPTWELGTSWLVVVVQVVKEVK